MAVTEYRPINTLGCRYSYDKLENVVYLVSKDHVKNVYIDNGEAYIEDLDEDPIRLEGFNIEFTEESSLDERYKFSKTVKFSLHGYVSHLSFNEKYYVILKSVDGTKWMVNVDFPSRVTYTFNLSANQYQTDFVFSSLSNFPTLMLATDIEDGVSPCKQLKTSGIEFLKLLETDYCTLESTSGIVHTYGKSFQDVEFLDQSCTLQESFDGEKLATTIQFNIAFDAYKSSWHYNLLEFLENHYSSVIKPKGTVDYFFSGFHFGLEPSFNVSTTSNNGNSDIITVTLKETSLQGSVKANRFTEIEETDTNWVYIRNVGVYKGYECVGLGIARFILKQEINQNGAPTGRYMCLEGHEADFPTLNIVGTFTEDYRFSNPECTEDMCKTTSNIPLTITYYTPTCYTYSYSSTCDWNVSDVASYLTVTPESGYGGSAYTLSICNLKVPTQNESTVFYINSGNNKKVVNVNLIASTSILNPQTIYIDCLSQVVSFAFDAVCPITVTSIDSRLSYQIRNAVLSVYVPRNYSTESAVTWTIGVQDCSGNTSNGYIIQDKEYEEWRNTNDYVCESGNSYVRQVRYTGTTPSTVTAMTTDTRIGALIMSGDTRCGGTGSRFVWEGNYYCIDGDKYEVMEQLVWDADTQQWVPNGVTMLGDMVEADSSFCNESLQYKWVLTENWQCFEGHDYSQDYLTFRATENGTFSFSGTSANTVQYSLDSGRTWTTLANSASTPTISSGNTVMWKGSGLTALDSNGIGRFSSSNGFEVEGNIMSLLYGDNFVGETSLSGKSNIFSYLFRGCTSLENAQNMVLPATILENRCYYGMFYDCNGLKTPPSVLLATTLAEYCYMYMFGGCYMLETAPTILATTLAEACCNRMFTNCSSLTTAPTLLASTLVASCYYRMFYGCDNLNSVTCLATDISATNCTNNWLYNVASNGTFTKAASMNDWTSGVSGIPSGWTVQDAQ